MRALAAWAAVPCSEGLSLAMLAETPAFVPLLRAAAAAGVPHYAAAGSSRGAALVHGYSGGGMGSGGGSMVGGCGFTPGYGGCGGSMGDGSGSMPASDQHACECLRACELIESCVESEPHDGKGRYEWLPPSAARLLLEAIAAGLAPVFNKAERRAGAAHGAGGAERGAAVAQGAEGGRGRDGEEDTEGEESGEEGDGGTCGEDDAPVDIRLARLSLLRTASALLRDGAISLMGIEATAAARVMAEGGGGGCGGSGAMAGGGGHNAMARGGGGGGDYGVGVGGDRGTPQRRAPPPPPLPGTAAAPSGPPTGTESHSRAPPPPPPYAPPPPDTPDTTASLAACWHLSRTLLHKLILCVAHSPAPAVESILEAEGFEPPLAAAAEAWPAPEARALLQMLAEAICSRARLPADCGVYRGGGTDDHDDVYRWGSKADGGLYRGGGTADPDLYREGGTGPSRGALRARLALRDQYLGGAVCALARLDPVALPTHALRAIEAAAAACARSADGASGVLQGGGGGAAAGEGDGVVGGWNTAGGSGRAGWWDTAGGPMWQPVEVALWAAAATAEISLAAAAVEAADVSTCLDASTDTSLAVDASMDVSLIAGWAGGGGSCGGGTCLPGFAPDGVAGSSSSTRAVPAGTGHSGTSHSGTGYSVTHDSGMGHSGSDHSGTGYFGPADAACGALLDAAVRDGPAWPPCLPLATPSPTEAPPAVSFLCAARVSLVGALSGWLKLHPSAHTVPLVRCAAAAAWHPHALTADVAVAALLAISHQIPKQVAADSEALSLLLHCARELPASTTPAQRLSVLQAAARVVATGPTQPALEALLTPVASQFSSRVAQLEAALQRAIASHGTSGTTSPSSLDTGGGSLAAMRASLVEACALLSAVIRPLRPPAAAPPAHYSLVGGSPASAAVPPAAHIPTPYSLVGGGAASASTASVAARAEGLPAPSGLPAPFLHALWPIWTRAFCLACQMAVVGGVVGGINGGGGGSAGAAPGAPGGSSRYRSGDGCTLGDGGAEAGVACASDDGPALDAGYGNTGYGDMGYRGIGYRDSGYGGGDDARTGYGDGRYGDGGRADSGYLDIGFGDNDDEGFGADGEADALVEAVASVAAACAWSCEVSCERGGSSCEGRCEWGGGSCETSCERGRSSCEASCEWGGAASAFLPFLEPMAAELIEAMRGAGEACGGLADP